MSKKLIYTSELLEFCNSPRERSVVESLIKTQSSEKTAKSTGVPLRSVQRTSKNVRDNMNLRRYTPGDSVTAPYLIKGVSQYHDKDGKPTNYWLKTNIDHAKQIEMLNEAIDHIFDDLPKLPVPKVMKKSKYDKDIIPWFQIGDAHLGMLAHESETGSNFDLKIAVSELMAAFKILFDESPTCERCVIQDLGDFTHYENMSGETDHSGHKLDFDGRFSKMIQVYVPLMRFIVESALKKFKFVDVIINQGNHSRTNDFWMRTLLANVYEADKRINVLDNSNILTPYRMGNTFVLTHHTDKMKPENLAKVMANDFAQDWGETEFRYIDGGHVHHSFSKELTGVTFESWNNLAPADKYAHDGGWRSKQTITRVDRSKLYGNVGRRTLSIEEIRDKVRAGLVKGIKSGYEPPTRKKVYTV